MSGSNADGPDLSQGVSTPERPRRMRPWLLAVIGAVLVVVICVVVWAAVTSANSAGSPSPSPSASATTAADDSAATSTSSPSASSDPSADATTAPDAAGGDVRATSAANPFDTPAEIAPGVTATVGKITSVDGVAKGVGETAGPAIRFEVTITNESAETIDLGLTTILVDYRADLVPGTQMSGNADQESFPASLASGKSATASYVFTVPVEDRESVRITIDYLAGVPLAVFAGSVPTS
ncbi:hypothetical protein ASF06_01870 [Agreia sp. Leaf244]|uniref:hypothetical protein n=1 Tax=Agreia sp. Leaf244 TaxID=1736305 RepID=UPI0006F393EB|nr:hypothetical protein [Agreia sp. Leaf244]KQO11425.1 hypothetical protein ASF06_01870 [Agreia sp. Leaf244]